MQYSQPYLVGFMGHSVAWGRWLMTIHILSLRWIQLLGNRFRSVCNMQIVNVTTPANFFHVLRRQGNGPLLVPYWADTQLDLIQWPPFLLASKIPIALDMEKYSNGKDRELTKRIDADSYMSCAVRECYASFNSIIIYLVREA